MVVESPGTAGVEPAPTPDGIETGGAGVVAGMPGTVVVPAVHLVQIVDVEVNVTVEMVLEVVIM